MNVFGFFSRFILRIVWTRIVVVLVFLRVVGILFLYLFEFFIYSYIRIGPIHTDDIKSQFLEMNPSAQKNNSINEQMK